jgi:hypothetical protein
VEITRGEAAREVEEAEAEFARLEAGLGIDAADIAASKTGRDESWCLHRVRLEAGTAEIFEREMRRHDEAEAVRFARADDTGKIAERRVARAAKKTKAKAAEAAAAQTAKAVAASAATHRETLASIGLSVRLTRKELSDWLKFAAVAPREAQRLEQEQAARAAALARGPPSGRR